ncbi:MAG: ABC transporter ATP-binding protein/permease [Lachnospiraceae bacterium]|nr:ABC transporter ATP-binding protein/permease [Lachnospiraceae bacterium]
MLKRLFSDYKKYTFVFIMSIVSAVISTAFSLLVPVLMGQGMDMIAGKGNVDFDGLMRIIKEMGMSVVIGAVFLWIMNGLNNRMVYGVSAGLRKRAFKSFVNSKLKFLDEHSEGEIISRIIVDCDGISDGLLLGFNQFFIGIVTLVITLVFMIRINLYLTIAVVIMTPLSLFVARFIAKKCNKFFAEQAKERGSLTDMSSDIITMKQVINNEGAEDYFEEKFEKQNKDNEEVSKKATFYSSLTNPLTRLVNAICYGVVTFGGAMLAIAGNITIGGLTSFLVYAGQFAKPFNDISSVVAELQNSLVCLRRIYELIDTESERESKAALSDDEIETDIEFKGVDFSYVESDDEDDKSAKLALTDITFTIPKGEKLGIVGASGSGKTTIMKLLLRYYDYHVGEIMIGGKDIRDMTVDELRSMMGLMLQEPFLITGSVMDNIRMGNDSASKEDVIKAAKECFAHDFIMNLPDGYDSIVTEENLSEGQRQLICITRLMLRDSSIVLLDEATSSIDILNEQLISKAFNKIMKGKTTVVVAHRLSTIQDSDKIIVVDDGKIIESGTHEELLDNKGHYYKLYNAQSAVSG